jgi:hypothetical protein
VPALVYVRRHRRHVLAAALRSFGVPAQRELRSVARSQVCGAAENYGSPREARHAMNRTHHAMTIACGVR